MKASLSIWFKFTRSGSSADWKSKLFDFFLKQRYIIRSSKKPGNVCGGQGSFWILQFYRTNWEVLDETSHCKGKFTFYIVDCKLNYSWPSGLLPGRTKRTEIWTNSASDCRKRTTVCSRHLTEELPRDRSKRMTENQTTEQVCGFNFS